MSTQADQIIAAIAADPYEHPADIVGQHDPDATDVDYQTIAEDTRNARARRRQVWLLTDGTAIAVEYDEGLHKHADHPYTAEAYRVVGREVTTTKYVREES